MRREQTPLLNWESLGTFNMQSVDRIRVPHFRGHEEEGSDALDLARDANVNKQLGAEP